MRRIFKADIHSIYIKNLQIDSTNAKNLSLATSIVKKDALFYENIFGKIVSFEYGCPLATEEEATFSVQEMAAKKMGNEKIDCIYINYDELNPQYITKEQYKKLKLTYRKKEIIN